MTVSASQTVHDTSKTAVPSTGRTRCSVSFPKSGQDGFWHSRVSTNSDNGDAPFHVHRMGGRHGGRRVTRDVASDVNRLLLCQRNANPRHHALQERSPSRGREPATKRAQTERFVHLPAIAQYSCGHLRPDLAMTLGHLGARRAVPGHAPMGRDGAPQASAPGSRRAGQPATVTVCRVSVKSRPTAEMRSDQRARVPPLVRPSVA